MSKTTIAEVLRLLVREHSRFRCCYCLTQEAIIGSHHTVDHIISEALGGETILENLCLACWDCNLAKQKRIAAIDPDTGEFVPLFHPVQQKWDEHFKWEAGASLLIGRTAIGRATVDALHLNRPILVQARIRWAKAGWHPPQD